MIVRVARMKHSKMSGKKLLFSLGFRKMSEVRLSLQKATDSILANNKIQFWEILEPWIFLCFDFLN